MIALEVERALARWVGFVGDPETGELSYRHGDSRVVIPIRTGADDRERPVPCIICASLEEQWEQDFPAANFRGVAMAQFLYAADPTEETAIPRDEALRLAAVIDRALHRSTLMQELSDASGCTLFFSGHTSGIQHTSATEQRHWLHVWAIPLYVCALCLNPSQEPEPCPLT